jgi:hypothetical protein
MFSTRLCLKFGYPVFPKPVFCVLTMVQELHNFIPVTNKLQMNSRTEIRVPIPEMHQKIITSGKNGSTSVDTITNKRIPGILDSEGNDDIRNYVEWLGLANDPKLVVLSSIHHYYYDEEEMKNVRTIVNMKELNHIKDVGNFLRSLAIILPSRCYLVGCFTDNKKQNAFSLRKKHTPDTSHSDEEENGIVSRIPLFNTIFSFLDARINNYLSGKIVTQLIENSGFSLIDMTEINGLTYFCAQCRLTSSEKSVQSFLA